MAFKRGYQGYSAAVRVAPEWTPAYLVFQGGVPRVRMGSLVGPGQIYGHEFTGPFIPEIKGYAPGVLSSVGPGQLVSHAPALLALLGGTRGKGS